MHTSPLAQPGSADAGGMNVYVRELTTALARSGTRCEVYTRREDTEQPAWFWVEPGLRVHHVAAGPPAPIAKELLAPLVGEWAAGVEESLSALSAQGDPVELLHANYWLSAAAGHNLKHVLSVPLVTTFHTLSQVKARNAKEAPEPGRQESEQRSAECSDLLVACSRSEAEDLVQLYGVGPERVATVLPGVHRAFFSPGNQAQARRAVGLPEGVPVVLFVGRIQPLKGLSVAVRAVAGLSGATRSGQALLVVVGGPSGPQGEAELANARAVAAQSGLAARVRWVPAIAHELLSSYYRAADVCVVPSWSESFGLVALEASACAVPVVASAVGGLADLVDHGRTGYLVDPGDVAGFARYLKELLDDVALARLMGAAALEATSSYTWPGAAAQFSELSSSLAGQDLVTCA